MALTSLEYAILASDSYNQGYEPYVDHGETTIGSDEVIASFYAAAYQVATGNIVISYRGTDDILGELPSWTGGPGFQTDQAELHAA